MPETTIRKPNIVTTSDALSSAIDGFRSNGKSIGVVPTMGALHDGHLSLVRASKSICDKTVVTIFVNPTQFAPGEDLERYPRDLDRDVALLQKVGTDIVFAPCGEEIYPQGFSTSVNPPRVANQLEGKQRPTHFQGVATIVLKLLNLTQADAAFFGQKDLQQSQVIKQMVRDLNLRTVIEVCPIVREPDGLAMSSRNAYLNADQRKRALSLSRTLTLARQLIGNGETDARALSAELNQALIDGGVSEVEYAAVVDPASLQTLDSIDGPVAVVIAAKVGAIRLIDNDIIRRPGN